MTNVNIKSLQLYYKNLVKKMTNSDDFIIVLYAEVMRMETHMLKFVKVNQVTAVILALK